MSKPIGKSFPEKEIIFLKIYSKTIFCMLRFLKFKSSIIQNKGSFFDYVRLEFISRTCCKKVHDIILQEKQTKNQSYVQ